MCGWKNQHRRSCSKDYEFKVGKQHFLHDNSFFFPFVVLIMNFIDKFAISERVTSTCKHKTKCETLFARDCEEFTLIANLINNIRKHDHLRRSWFLKYFQNCSYNLWLILSTYYKVNLKSCLTLLFLIT